MEYFKSFLGWETKTAQYTLLIASSFAKSVWSSSVTFNKIAEIFENKFGVIFNEILFPQFDAVITKICYCQFAYRTFGKQFMPRSYRNNRDFGPWKFGKTRGKWLICSIKQDSMLVLHTSKIKYFISDQTMIWILNLYNSVIGWFLSDVRCLWCTGSLGDYTSGLNFSFVNVDDYQYGVRNFIFAELGGFVSQSVFFKTRWCRF